MTIPEIRLDCLKIAAMHQFPHCEHLKYQAELLFEWVFKKTPHSEIDSQVISKLNSLNSKLDKMNQDLEQIKADLTEANTTLGKVKADVTLLHSKVDGIAGQPTAEEWAEVKSLAANLKTALKEVDDQTAEEGGDTTTGNTP